MSVIEASREAAFFFFGLVGKYCPFLEKKTKFFCKNEKKSPHSHLFNHPAATPETEVFFSMAPFKKITSRCLPRPEAESGRPCFVYEPLRPDQVKHLKHPSTTSQPDNFFIYFPTLPKTTQIHIAFCEIRRLDGVSETHEKRPVKLAGIGR